MAWIFTAIREEDVADVISKVQVELNSIATSTRDGRLPALTAKVALANRNNDDAFGVVFYDNQIAAIPGLPEDPVEFQEFTARLSGSDPTDLYRQVADKLNTLSAYGAFWAKVGLTNRESGDTTLTLYWPEVAG